MKILLVPILALAIAGLHAQTAVPLTSGPHYHWFGYYDKQQFDPSGRYLLGMETTFENRTPQPADTLTMFMLDLENGNARTDLGTSDAWCWQQGCMLQWLPGSTTKVIWNDRDDTVDPPVFVARIHDTATSQTTTIPHPIYTIHPNGRTALSLDFPRLHDTRPGYGYAGIEDPNENVNQPTNGGVYSIDLATGVKTLIISLKNLADLGTTQTHGSGDKHRVNHLVYNPSGTRFAMLHRWPGRDQLVTANIDGTDLRVVNDGPSSHYDWKNDSEILIWGNRSGGSKFWLLTDVSGGNPTEIVGNGVMDSTGNGHCIYLYGQPQRDWILNDTYPRGGNREQTPYLYHVPTNVRTNLGDFASPPDYSGEWRCDTHPRSSPDGTKIVIDSPHGGNGRQMYLIDVADIINGNVDAGDPVQAALPHTAVTLNGTSTLEPGSTYFWTQVSGPSATLATPSALQTSVTLSTAGSYVFQLSGDDGDGAVTDTVTVTLLEAPSLSTGLVGYWKFDEGTGTTLNDISGLNHHANLNGTGGGFSKKELSGSSGLSLGNQAWAESPDTAALSVTGAFTLSVWIHSTDSSSRGILAKYRNEDDTLNARAYNLQLVDGKPQFLLSKNGQSGEGTNSYAVNSATTIPLDRWVHLACVYVPGTSMRI